MLGASMFAPAAAQVWPEAPVFAQQPVVGAEPKPMLGVPGASELPEVVVGVFPQLMPGVRPEASAFPQLMPGARPEMLGGGGYPFGLRP